ncbi:MAG: NAD kinase, partial [Lactobacillus sp.]|nr:NAD kinase [Lactobacillus sp.]
MKVTIAHNNYDKTLQTVAYLKKLLKEKDVIFDAKYPDVVISVGGDGTL